MWHKKKKEEKIEKRAEPSEKRGETVKVEAYEEEKGGVILKDDNKEGMRALLKLSEEVQVEQDHDANVKSIGFNGKLNVENPSEIDRLWDINITLSNIEGTNLESDQIIIKELGITNQDNRDSREFQISGEAKNLLLVKEYINTLPNSDDILNIQDIEKDLLRLRDQVSKVKAEKLEQSEETEIEEEIGEEKVEPPEIVEEVEELEVEEEEKAEDLEVTKEVKEEEVAEEVEEEEKEEVSKVARYQTWTVEELKEYCRELGITIPPKAKKAEIIDLIIEAEEETEEDDGGTENVEYNLESFGISINTLNTITFALALHSLFEKPITNLRIVKKIPSEFGNLEILETTQGSTEVANDQIIWTIDKIEPETTILLKISSEIQVDTKEPVKTGRIEVSYKAESSFTGGLAIEKFNAFTNNRHFVDMIEKDEQPGLWDCKLVFKNPSEFFIELYNIDIYTPDDPNTKFVTIDEELKPKLPAGAEWHSALWQYESDDYPSFRKELDFSVLSELKAEVAGSIAIEDVDLVLASITGTVAYEVPGIPVTRVMKEEIIEEKAVSEEITEEAEISEEVKIEEEVEIEEKGEILEIRIPSYKETEIQATLTITNDGSAPLNEVRITQKAFTDIFRPPHPDDPEKPDKITLLWDEKEIELDPESVTIDEDTIRIQLKNLKESPMGMFEPDSTIEVKYPIHAESPPKDTEFDTDVVYNANTYPLSQELEYIPEPDLIPLIKVIHIRRKYRVAKEIIPLGELGNYQIILNYQNLGDMPIRDFILLDKVPDNFEYSDFSLEPEITDEVGTDTLKWNIQELKEDEKLEISYKIKGTGEYRPSDAQLAF